ncbi:MAG: AMP-binding protein [Anaerolineae bacterium]|nr:AMP-binding protein [Anaerolineae bacterium]
MLVQDFLQNSVARTPDKVALVFQEQRLTYQEMDAQANRLAQALLDHGVQRGDRVAIYLPNSVEAAVAIFAILKAGAVFSVINPTTKLDKLAYILNDCRVTGLVTQARRLGMLEELQDWVPSLKSAVLCGKGGDKAVESREFLAFEALQQIYPNQLPPQKCIDVDLACLIYTSGTTGEPKGVMSAHYNVVAAASSIIQYLENVPEDIVINVLPLSFDYGLYQLLMTFKFGGTLVLEKSFAYPAAVLKLMEKERGTGFPGVPTIFAILLQMDLSKYDLSSLRYITNTAAALPPSHILQLRQKFPWATLYSMYGLTECKRVSYLPPEELDRRPGSVGIAIPNTEVWIVDEDGNRVDPGVVGELVVRGSHVMRGYWEKPKATDERYRPGPIPGERALYTGDLFKMDEEGFLYFVARKDDIIKSRGEKVSPKEVENVLYSLDGVVEAAVIGVPDGILGEAIKAFVVRGDGNTLTERDVLRHCSQHLEDFMVPKYVEFRSELPKTTSGKIKKTGLK